MGRNFMKKISSEDFKSKLLNQIFGKAKIIGFAGRPKGRFTVLCECLNCGEITERRYDHLVRNNPEHCKKCVKETYRHPERMTPLNRHFSNFKSSAKTRNLLWELSLEEFEKVSKENCFYCGEPAHELRSLSWAGRNKSTYVKYIANGIDRIDSNKGYSINNIVSCCPTCNIMKNKFSLDVFYDKIRKIYNLHLK